MGIANARAVRVVGTAALRTPAARLLRRPCSTALSLRNAALQRELDAARRELAEAKALSASKAKGMEEQREKSYFVGAFGSAYTPELRFWDPRSDAMPQTLPVFRLIDDLGKLVPGAEAVPALSREEALAMMQTMVRVQEFDKVFLESQRQGRIPFYLTSRGEEAASVGSAAALHPTDWMLPQYREMGAMFWRGFSFADVANQLVANGHDTAHGRQLGLPPRNRGLAHVADPVLTTTRMRNPEPRHAPRLQGQARRHHLVSTRYPVPPSRGYGLRDEAHGARPDRHRLLW